MDREFTSKEISIGIEVSLNTINRNLISLRKSEYILFRLQPKGKGGYLYKYDHFYCEVVPLLMNGLSKNKCCSEMAMNIKKAYRLAYQQRKLAKEHYNKLIKFKDPIKRLMEIIKNA